MRVWVVDDQASDNLGALGNVLRPLQERATGHVQVLGVSAYQPDFTTAMTQLLPDLLDLILIREKAWPAGADLQPVLALGAGLVIATSPVGVERFRGLTDQHPVWFVREAPDVEELWLALVSAHAGRRRHLQGRSQLQRLQQRLDDRIIIERAKGILVQRLKITEEEAYQKLRLQSRRQRRQVRDIAQSLLDTQSLLEPAGSDNGTLPVAEDDVLRQHDQTPPTS